MSKGKVIEYTLDEAWDVTTATFSDDGSSMFLYYPEVMSCRINGQNRY